MAQFSEIETKVAQKINELTLTTIQNLKNEWTEVFEPHICEENILKLSEHVEVFYGDIMLESTQRKERIRSEIEKLQQERLDLCRLLHLDIPLVKAEGMPLYTFKIKMDESLADLRQILKRRREQIYELLLEQDTLCDELGETPQPLLDDPLPTEEMLAEFRLHLEALKAIKVNRVYEISTLRRDIKSFLEELELKLEYEEDERLLNDRCLPLTENNVKRLKQLREQYCKQMEEVREAIDTIKKKLNALWDCLETSPSVRAKFQKYNDYTQTTYDKLYQELDRCETQKRQNVKKFIDKIREDIVMWWDRTLKSDVERARFSNFTNDCYTEDLLTLHEMELEDLKRFYYNNEKIFDLISERRILWDRMIALEAKASEPGRFNNRGGQLLKEEKERKTIASKLPKIEGKLLELVQEFENVHQKKFLVNGEDIVETIEREWEKRREDRDKLMSARKNAGGTPHSKSIIRTPLSCRNQTPASFKKLESTKNLLSLPASKRKLPSNGVAPPSAKRSLISQLASPMPKFKPPLKSPRKKLGVVSSTLIRRRSGRLSTSRKLKKKPSVTPRKLPKILVSSYENSVTSDTVCYENFEEHLVSDPKCRSSILHPDTKERKNNLRTPMKRRLRDQSTLKRSPAALSRTTSPLAGPSSRKLTTKNLPIII